MHLSPEPRAPVATGALYFCGSVGLSRPGLLSLAHGKNEYVDLRKAIDCAAIYALTAIDMLQTI
jgi:acetylornithine deacetylase/succinyl-diaminopimelate desuccinylase-like protein